jgi:hypothetical protein
VAADKRYSLGGTGNNHINAGGKMEPHWAQILAWLAATATFLVTAFRIVAELRETREQRASELRWKQEEVGKSLNDEMQTDERAWPAMQMLDSVEREFAVSESLAIRVNQADIGIALDPATQSNPKVDFIYRLTRVLNYLLRHPAWSETTGGGV